MPSPNVLAFIVISAISAVTRTDGQTDIASLTRLAILIQNIYTLWGRQTLIYLLHTYIPTNLIYHSILIITYLAK